MQNVDLSEAEFAAFDAAIRELLRLSNWHAAEAQGADPHLQHRRAADVAALLADTALCAARRVDASSVDDVLAELHVANALLRNPRPTSDVVDAVWLRRRHADVLSRLGTSR